MCPDRGDIDPGESSLGGTGGKEERASRTGQDHEAGPSRLQGADGGSVQGHRADVRQHHSFRHYNEAGPSTHRPMAASSSSSSPPSRSAPPPYSPAPITSHASRQHADTANTSDRAYTDRTLDRTGAAFAAGGEQVKQGQISSGHGQIGQVGQEGHEDRGDRFVSANPSNTVHHSFEFASASTSSPTQMPTARSGHAPESSDASFSSLSGSTYSSGRSTMASTPTATRPSIPRVRSGSGSGSTSTSDRNSTSSSTTTPSTTSTAYFAPSTRSSMSTAFSPTFPSSISGTQRVPRAWVPTTNVPEHISRRHRKQDGGSRWLSEDEGIGGSGLARRRGSAGTSGSRGGGGGGGGVGPSASASGSGFGTGLGIGIGAGVGMSGQGAAGGYGDRPRRAPAPIPLDSIAQPSTQQHHLDQSSPVQSHHGGAVAGPGPSSQSKPRLIKHPSDIRPSHATQQAHDAERVRRISSPSIPSAPADLPQIRNLLPRTTVPGLTASGMTQGDPAGTLAMRGGADLPDPPISPKSYYPTSVQGVSERDEDEGHSWVGPQTDKEKVWWNVQKEDEVTKRPGETERQRSKRELVGKLRRLMTCNLCPPGTHRTFHHPLTLPCGHTLSSDHLSIPCPAPLALPASTPPHELYAAEQKQHAQRLALWAGVMCPIPTCKRYSPYAVSGVSHEPNSPTTAFRSMSAPAVIAPTVMSSGVPVYPSQAPAPPYSADPVFHEVGSPLLDTAVDKVLGLVLLATGEEGEAYSRTFDKDKTKGKESDMSADKSTVKGRDREGEMDVDVVGAQTGHARGATGITDEMDDVRMSSSLGQSGGPHAAGTSSDRASGHAPSGPISIPMTMGEASTSVNEPNSPVSSTTRSPSLKRPRNRLGTGSVDSGASDDITLDTAAETSDQSLEEYIRHAVDTGRATNANEARAQYNARPGVADRTEAQSKSGPIDGSDDVTSALRSDDPVSSASGDEPRSGSHHERDGEASSLVGSTSKPPVFSLGKSDHADADSFKVDLQGVLECDVCAQLLFEPVTTPCQHSFCSKCLARSLDHSQRCPVCRQNLPSFAFFNENTVNRVLLTILKTAFPTEYAERAAAIEKDERDARLNTPIFVCTLAFPGMPTILHVFEPRYRLMIRRCIESDTPRFGMVLPSRASRAGANGNAGAGMFPMAIAPPNAAAGAGLPGPAGAAGDVGAGAAANAEAAIAGGELGGIGGVMEYGTMLEIQSVQMLPDGRSMVETVGTHRFRLLEKGSLDGYTIGRVERIDDIPPEEEAALEAQAVRAAKAAKDARAAHSRSLFGHRTTGNAGVSMTSVPGAQPVSMPSSSSGPAMHPDPPQASPSQPGMPPHAPLPIDDTPQSTAELMNICRSFIDQLRSGSAPWLLQRLNNTYGSMPTDPSEFSYWMALVMPIDEFEKARLLPIRSPRLRLKLIVHWVESLRSSWWFSSG